MKNSILKIATILVFGMAIMSCSKDGEPGKDGANGTNGIAGTNGTNGQTGTANVMYSNWINQNWNFTDVPKYKEMRIVDNRISTTFLNNGGIVLGFFRFQENVVFQLPYTSTSQNNIRAFYPVFFATNGEIRFAINSTDGTDLENIELTGGASSFNAQYKYVLIPGGVNIVNRGITTPNYSKMSYKEICTKFNIPE